MRGLVLAVLCAASRIASAQSPTPTPPDLPASPALAATPRMLFALAVGTGGGVIGGETEGIGADVATGVQWAPLHLRADLAAFRSRQFAIGISGRLGFPLGADVGDPPAAKSVMFRAYWLCPIGLRMIASVGAGYIRYRVGVDGSDVDTMAAGPVLAGFATGWAFRLSRRLLLTVDAQATAALAVTDRYESIPNEHALHLDLEVGLTVLR